MMDRMNVKKDLETTFFPDEFHNEDWETIKLVLYVMLTRRDRVCPNNSAQACAGITSCSGYGPPLT